MRVAILITIPNPDQFHNCTLCFNTIRTGFPNAELIIYDNNNDPLYLDLLSRRIAPSRPSDFIHLSSRIHHADWIREQIYSTSGPLCIIDPDTIFWESCEDFTFPTTLAGHYIPLIYNEFARCISFERLHTAFLQIKDCEQLVKEIESAYPDSTPYNPCDPFISTVRFVCNRPFFWDSCATLYNMLGGSHFQPHHLSRYSHINSSSFYDEMLERLENSETFKLQHEIARTDPELMRNFYLAEDAYYASMHEKAVQMLQQIVKGG